MRRLARSNGRGHRGEGDRHGQMFHQPGLATRPPDRAPLPASGPRPAATASGSASLLRPSLCALVVAVQRAHRQLPQPLIGLLDVQPIHEQHVELNPYVLDEARHLHRPAMGPHVDIDPAEDGQDGGADDDEVEQPVRQMPGLKVTLDFIGVWIEKRREGLDGEQIHEDDEEQRQEHRRRDLP